MVLIKLLDGTRNVSDGKALIPAFSEIAKYRKILIDKIPGGIDVSNYNFVKSIENRSYNFLRDQVNLKELLELSLNERVDLVGKNSLILIENDLYADNLNWCFGGVFSDFRGGKHLAMSTYRLKDLNLFSHVATHELGHMFGAATLGRKNVESKLGSHCLNECIMQQKLTVSDMVNHARILSKKRDKFCYECQKELSNY